MKNVSLFKQVFNEMPNEFTSHEFTTKLYELGISKKQTAGGQLAEWFKTNNLAKNAKFGSKTWVKLRYKTSLIPSIKGLSNNETIIIKSPESARFESNLTEQQCIDFLKQTGKYKIIRITIHEEVI